MCAVTRDLFAIAKFLFLIPTCTGTVFSGDGVGMGTMLKNSRGDGDDMCGDSRGRGQNVHPRAAL